ncbi:carboxymuconolactone decarboxylase family protein [Chryseolinea sp. T2]|uniref:carboxymuconolactone decarboxylase family protein n=1 Tax=Chryseolinea sp. T2 TaxID=3129255 RepID=UPI0030771E87
METRLNIFEHMAALKPVFGLAGHLNKSSLEVGLRELINFRISQINGCAYCLDMHGKDARHRGESEQRLYTLSAWRETPFFTDRERAALAFAEAVNKAHVPDAVYEAAKSQFTDAELIDLTIAVSTINIWNRLNITFGNEVGTYQVGQFA